MLPLLSKAVERKAIEGAQASEFMLSRSLWQPFAILTLLTILAIWWSSRTQGGAANGPDTSFSNISKVWQYCSIKSATEHSASPANNGVSDRSRPHCPDLKSISALKVSLYDVQHGEGFEQIQDAISKPAIAIRCKHANGGWCLQAVFSNLTTIARPPPLGTRSCTAGCNGVGNCNADTGACDCPAGIALTFSRLWDIAQSSLQGLYWLATDCFRMAVLLERACCSAKDGRVKGACSGIQGHAQTSIAGELYSSPSCQVPPDQVILHSMRCLTAHT